MIKTRPALRRHLLVTGSEFRAVSEVGALLSDCFTTCTLAHSLEPLRRAFAVDEVDGLFTVVLLRDRSEWQGHDLPSPMRRGVVFVVPDVEWAVGLEGSGATILSAGVSAVVFQATVLVLAAQVASP